MKVREAREADVVESGNVFFVYRPRVNDDQVRGLDDVQRLFMILEPEQGADRFRRIVLGRKQLPEPENSGRRRFWGFVDEDGRDPAQLDLAREPEQRQTKTRGQQVQPEDRPVGEGVYAVARHGGHTHFSYELEIPKHPGQPQAEFNLAQEASYIVSVKNPDVPSPRGAGLAPSRRAELPEKLQRRFRNDAGGQRRFIDLDAAELLDHPGVELIFVAASGDPHAELGLDLDREDETADSAETVRELDLDPQHHPTRPLFERRWE